MVLPGFQDKKVVLASASPRRELLMRGLDIPLEIVRDIPVDESYPGTLDPQDIPVYLARKKADAASGLLKENSILLTADTIVILDDKVIEKPRDATHARSMLIRLSGNMHRVLTGVCMRSVEKEICFTAESKVYFSKLSTAEIDYYVEKYHPFDKAGSYGIQEWIGYAGVERIEGSFFNVMGLPVHRVYKYLKEF